MAVLDPFKPRGRVTRIGARGSPSQDRPPTVAVEGPYSLGYMAAPKPLYRGFRVLTVDVGPPPEGSVPSWWPYPLSQDRLPLAL